GGSADRTQLRARSRCVQYRTAAFAELGVRARAAAGNISIGRSRWHASTWPGCARERPTVQCHAQCIYAERAESREFYAAEWEPIVCVLRPAARAGRDDRDVAWRRAEHLQSENRRATSVRVLM